MPLDVVRFAQSDLVAFEAPEAIVAALLLWGAAWHGTPAASLTDDDRTLSNLAGYGRAVGEFLKVKEGALRGFVKCSDGRLYHPVVAEKAREAWTGKLKQRHRTFCATIRKHNERNPGDTIDAPTFEDWMEAGRPDRVTRDSSGTAPKQRDLPLAGARTGAGASPMPDEDDARRNEADERRANVTRDEGDMSRVTGDNVTRDGGGLSRECHAENRSKGEGQGEGQGEGDSTIPPKPPADLKPADGVEDLMGVTNRIANAGGVSIVQPRKLTAAMDLVKRWLADGIDVDTTILPTIEQRLADMPPNDTVGSLAYFDAAIRKAHALAKSKTKRPRAKPVEPIAASDAEDERVPTIREKLKASIGAPYGAWIAPGRAAISIDDGIVVVAPNKFASEYIETNFLGDLAKAARAVLGTNRVEVRTI